MTVSEFIRVHPERTEYDFNNPGNTVITVRRSDGTECNYCIADARTSTDDSATWEVIDPLPMPPK